jgi:hypothetical protein
MMIRDRILKKLEETHVAIAQMEKAMTRGPEKSKKKLDAIKLNWKPLSDKEYQTLSRFHDKKAEGFTNEKTQKVTYTTTDGHHVEKTSNSLLPTLHKVTTKDGKVEHYIDSKAYSEKKAKNRKNQQ